MNYSEINLNENIQKGLLEAGYVTCTPVQEKVLQASLDGTDLYVQSQTGTGKTAAFLVSIMQELLSKNTESKKTALVMVPTRELATQVEDEAKKLGKFTGLRFASFFGGVGYEKQVEKLKKGVDVIIGTPGRLIDLQESKQMDLSTVSILAIDEADRMFDMGFYPELRKLIKVLPTSENRQTMLFSATLNLNVKNLAYEYTKNPKEITIEAENITVDEINQVLMHVSSEDKNRLLVGIIQREKPESFIIFCNTKKMCEIVSKRLKINNIENEFIIGDLPQKKRQQIMNNFKSKKIKCLIATDVAARGIDVNDLQMVINYDLPNEAENYVHRIGRTARAGKSGKAYSFCSDSTEDAYNLMGIESYIEKKIPFVVAIEEDFGEDKSKDVYIKLGDWKESDSKSHNEKNHKDNKNHKKENKHSKKTNKSKKDNNRMTNSEIEKLSNLSFEERMKLYKERYSSENNNNSKKSDVKSNNNQKNKSNQKKNFDKTDSNKTNNENKNEAKKGIFAKIKSLFSKK